MKINQILKAIIAIVLIIGTLFVFAVIGHRFTPFVQNEEPHEGMIYVEMSQIRKLYFDPYKLDQNVDIYNLDINQCQMNYTLLLADEILLWKSGDIYPGFCIRNILLNRILPAGVYQGKMLVKCYSLVNGNELLSCMFDCEIIVG